MQACQGCLPLVFIRAKKQAPLLTTLTSLLLLIFHSSPLLLLPSLLSQPRGFHSLRWMPSAWVYFNSKNQTPVAILRLDSDALRRKSGGEVYRDKTQIHETYFLPLSSALSSLTSSSPCHQASGGRIAEHRWSADLDRRVPNDVDQRSAFVVAVSDVPNAVLDHHDRAIDDHAEVDRTQAEQTRRDAVLQHAAERAQHRQRNRQRDDRCRSEVAQKCEQHRDHQ